MTDDPYAAPDAPLPESSSGGMSESDVRQWTMFIHFSALSGMVIPLGSLIGPLILWQIKKAEAPEIDRHGRVVMNAMISYFLYSIGAAILILIIIGIPLLFALVVASIACPIIGGIKANDGHLWRYPLAIKFL